jgi:hypothetical protein
MPESDGASQIKTPAMQAVIRTAIVPAIRARKP